MFFTVRAVTARGVRRLGRRGAGRRRSADPASPPPSGAATVARDRRSASSDGLRARARITRPGRHAARRSSSTTPTRRAPHDVGDQRRQPDGIRPFDRRARSPPGGRRRTYQVAAASRPGTYTFYCTHPPEHDRHARRSDDAGDRDGDHHAARRRARTSRAPAGLRLDHDDRPQEDRRDVHRRPPSRSSCSAASWRCGIRTELAVPGLQFVDAASSTTSSSACTPSR